MSGVAELILPVVSSKLLKTVPNKSFLHVRKSCIEYVFPAEFDVSY
jgi:hypothetical protein